MIEQPMQKLIYGANWLHWKSWLEKDRDDVYAMLVVEFSKKNKQNKIKLNLIYYTTPLEFSPVF